MSAVAASFLGWQLASLGGGAMDAGHGGADRGFGRRHGAASDEVQIANGGAAQRNGSDATATAALGGEEGGDVGGVGWQAGQAVFHAPVAPGAHAGAVGAAGVACGRPPGVGEGGAPRGGQGGVVVRDRGRRGVVEPVPHDDRRLAEWHRGNRVQAGRDPLWAGAVLRRQVLHVGRGERLVVGVRQPGWAMWHAALCRDLCMPDKDIYPAYTDDNLLTTPFRALPSSDKRLKSFVKSTILADDGHALATRSDRRRQ